jgi:hydrogenase maturation protease
LAVIEPDPPNIDSVAGEVGDEPLWNSHSMDPTTLLRLASRLGAPRGRVLVVGCQPSPLVEEADIAAGLSEPVRGAVEPAAELVVSLVAQLRGETPAGIVGDEFVRCRGSDRVNPPSVTET